MAKKKPAGGQPPSSPRSPSPAVLQMLAPWLEELRRRYEAHDDPFRAWEAYAAHRALRKQPPPWVLAYLDRVAANIGAIEAATTIALRDASGTVYPFARRHAPLASLLGVALEMTKPGTKPGKGTLLSRQLARRGDALLAQAVADRIAQGAKETAAVKAVAKTHRSSESTVGNAYRAMKATGRLPTS